MTTKKNNSFYVTTSIAYANAKPHLGFAMEMIQADALARYHAHNNDQAYFLTGTDEHGQKLQEAAEKSGKSTQQFVDELSAEFRNLAKILNLSNDDFVRTTDPAHKKAAQKLWLACKDDIYKSKYEGMYCVGHEAFLKDSDLVDGVCPDHKTKPQKMELESYFFKLSKYAPKLKELIETGRINIVPKKRRNEMLSFIESGLEDVSISRPKSQLSWGIEVPNDSEHVMYVWFDALTNYISAIGYESDSEKFQKYWPANVHVIGKDIARFHCLLWPAMLLSGGLEVPEAVYVHGFITSDGQKMSKSLGNIIDPVDFANSHGSDALRYYLLRYIPSYNDGDFSNSRFEEVYNADLANTLGNLVSRLVVMINKYSHGKYQKQSVEPIGISDFMSNFQFDRALEAIFARLSELNVAIDEAKPWEIYKTDPQKATMVLDGLASELEELGLALKPFIPNVAAEISNIFKSGKVSSAAKVLFPKIQ